jgi:hypothetical protein
MLVRIVSAVVLAFGLVFAACSDEEEDTTTPAPTGGTPSPAKPETPAETPPDDATPTPTPTTGEPAASATQAAIDALATWLGPVADPASISVSSVEPVTWPNGCLGLGRVGQVCTEALVEGFRVELALGNGIYEVRTDQSGGITLWAPSTQIMATFQEGLTNLFTFTTDDGGTLEAQPVFGTDYGVDPDTLAEGDAVGVALADAPQNGPQLLVWLDPAQ